MSRTDVVVTDRFDQALLDGLVVAAPAFGDMLDDLDDLPTGRQLGRDVFILFWHAAPRLRDVADLDAEHQRNHEVLSALLALPEVEQVRAVTVHDPYLSVLVSLCLAAGLQQALTQTPVAAAARLALRRPLREAQREAQDEVGMLVSWGADRGTIAKMPYRERAALAERVRQPSLVALLEKMSHFAPCGLLGQPEDLPGTEAMPDVELSDRVVDAPASSYARLANRHLRLDFYRQVAEGTLLTTARREQRSLQPGPVTVCIDVSQSMREQDTTGSTREAWAKAFSLALLRQARRAGRDVTLLLFADRTRQQATRFPGADPLDLDKLVRVMERSFGGGTDFASVLDKALAASGWTRSGLRGPGHIVFVTDGECLLSEEQVARTSLAKQSLDARIYGIAVGDESSLASMQLFSDEVFSIDEFRNVVPVNRKRARN